MIRYAGWLDGETLKINRERACCDYRTQADQSGQALKLSALLGHRIALSDVQLIDSSVLLAHFLDQPFRDFLRADPEWLQLRARPSREDVASEVQERRARARSGLFRSQAKGWVSSTYTHTARVVEYFAWLEEHTRREFGVANLLAEAHDSGRLALLGNPKTDFTDDDLLTGATYALEYFGMQDGVSRTPASQASETTFDVVIDKLAEPDEEDEVALDATRRILESFGDDNARKRRSALQTALKERNYAGVAYDRIWNTAVMAWNCAIATSMEVDGGVYGHLPHAVRVPTYYDKVSDLVVEDRRFVRDVWRQMGMLPDPSLYLNFDLNTLSWSDIQEIVRSDEVRLHRVEYQRALTTRRIQDDITPFKKLNVAIAQAVARRVKAPSQMRWYLFGAPMVFAALPGDGPIMDGLKGTLATEGAYKLLCKAARRVTEYQVMNTVSRFVESPTHTGSR